MFLTKRYAWRSGAKYLTFVNTKNGKPISNNLATNSCFNYKNVFLNGVNALSKIVLKNIYLKIEGVKRL